MAACRSCRRASPAGQASYRSERREPQQIKHFHNLCFPRICDVEHLNSDLGLSTLVKVGVLDSWGYLPWLKLWSLGCCLHWVVWVSWGCLPWMEWGSWGCLPWVFWGLSTLGEVRVLGLSTLGVVSVLGLSTLGEVSALGLSTLGEVRVLGLMRWGCLIDSRGSASCPPRNLCNIWTVTKWFKKGNDLW